MNNKSTFERLVAERDNIIVKFLAGDYAGFEKLREICKSFNNEHGKEVIVTSGSDKQLWESVSNYFLQLRMSHD